MADDRLLQGVYLDDLLVLYKGRLHLGRVPRPLTTDPDACLLAKCMKAYEGSRLPMAADKSYRYSTKFAAWGARVDGVAGTLDSGRDRRLALMKALSFLILDGFTTKKIMQEILGHVAFSFSFRKIFMSLLHRSYKFVESLPERSWRSIPPDIIDELRAVFLHLPIA